MVRTGVGTSKSLPMRLATGRQQNPYTAKPKGMVDAGESNSRATRNILVAIDALLRVNRIDSAIQILETELGRGC